MVRRERGEGSRKEEEEGKGVLSDPLPPQQKFKGRRGSGYSRRGRG